MSAVSGAAMHSNRPFILGGLILGVTAFLAHAEPFDQFTVEKIRGDSCQIKAKGAGDWKKASEGGVHASGSGAKTGGGSTMTLAFDEKNKFRVLPKTEVIVSVSTRDSKFRKVIDLSMKDGDVEVDLDAFPEKYQFKVQTPTAVCGAVGTRFKVSSNGAQNSAFETDQGSIFAASREDGSFYAPSIKAGQRLDANAAPGKENSYTRLKVQGGKMPVAFGSRNRTLELTDGSIVKTAQERSNSTDQVAVKVEGGSVGGQGSGQYVMKDGKMEDLSDDQDGADLVDDYVGLSEKEGSLQAKLEKAKASGASSSEISNLEQQLDEAAEKASDKRKELFQHRDVIRRTIRGGVEAIRNRPTQAPSIPRPGGYP
jgi:FecR-like protein